MPTSLRIELFPVDLDASVRFYVDVLRFVVVRDDRPRGEAYVALRRDDVPLGLAERATSGRGSRRPPRGVELVLEVDDVRAEHDVVSSKVAPDEDLVDRPWGLTDFRLLDPDGYYWRVTDRGEGA